MVRQAREDEKQRNYHALRNPPSLLSLVITAVVALMVVDILVNLRLIEFSVTGRHLYSRPTDFLGLLLADAQIATALAIVAWAGSWLGRRLGIGRSVLLATTTLVAGLCGAHTMVGLRSAWRFSAGDTTSALTIALIVASLAALLTALALREPRGRVFLTGQGRLIWVLLLSSLVAGSVIAIPQLERGQIQRGLANLILFAICLLAALVARHEARGMFRLLSWTPVALTMFMAIVSSVALPKIRIPDQDIAKCPSCKNLVLIVMDTVRADHIPLYGYNRDTMPNLGRWALQATLFERAVSPSGWTSPAHASIFSGKTVSQHGIHDTSSRGVAKSRAMPGTEWLPTILGDLGYKTVAVSANPLALPPDIEGFSQRIVPDRYPWWDWTVGALYDSVGLMTRNLSERLRWRMTYVDSKGIVRVVKTIEAKASDRPLFLFINMLDAHSPYNPPYPTLSSIGAEPSGSPFGRYLTDDQLTQSWKRLPDEAHERLIDLYDGELRWLDENLAQLLEWIDQELGNDSVVVITSDHGEELGVEGRVGHAYGLSQRLLHIPLLIRMPGTTPGKRLDTVTTQRLFDFFIAVATDLAHPLETLVKPSPEGILSERYSSASVRELLGSESNRDWVSLIEGEFKGVGPSGSGMHIYDIASAGFSTEIAVTETQSHQDLVSRIDAYWEKWRDRRSESPTPIESDREIDRMRALGYLD